MSAKDQLSFEPSLDNLRADDVETADSDIWFVKIHYETSDNQSSASRIVMRLPTSHLDPEIDSDGKPTKQFGTRIYVDRRKPGESELTEGQPDVQSVVHSLRQLHTKLKMNDCIIEKPSLLSTTVRRVGYEGDFDLLEELVGKCNLFQDTYPFCFVKTSQKVRPQVDFQFTISRTPGPRDGGQFALEERGILGLKDVINGFTEVEVPEEGSIKVLWPTKFNFPQEKIMDENEYSLLPIVLRTKNRSQTQWIRQAMLDQESFEKNLHLENDHFLTHISSKTSVIVEVHFFLGKSHVTFKKADLETGDSKTWQNLSFQSMSRSEQKKLIDQKLVTLKGVDALSEKLSRLTKSQMFFYSYSNFENVHEARMVSFESLPDYSKVPRMPVALEEFLSKKLKKK